MEDHSFMLSQSPSLMYQLCEIGNAGQVEKSVACQAWFRQAADHCTAVLDTSTHTVLERVVSYLFPSFRKLQNFEEITTVDSDSLSISDCKLLLAKMARDYVAREPHYKLAEYTVLALWTILILTVAIVALVAIGVVYTRFSGKIKKIFDEKHTSSRTDQSGTHQAGPTEQTNDRPKDPNKERTKIEEVLKYDILDTEQKFLSVMKQVPKVITENEESIMKPNTSGRTMNFTQKAPCESVNFRVGYIEPRPPFADEIIDSLYL